MTENEQKKQTEEKYDLYTENIVTKPWLKYKRLIQVVLFFAAAVSFGVIVTLVVTYLYPLINKTPGETYGNIIIEKDSYPAGETESTTDSGGEENSSEQGTQESAADIREVADEVRKSLVQIQVAKLDEELLSSVNESEVGDMFTSFTGIIVAREENEYYVLTRYSYMDKAKRIAVKFNDGNVCEAEFIGYQKNTDMALLYVRVSRNQIISEELVDYCSLGTSYAVKPGDELFVMGRILGNADSMNYGMCISNSSAKQIMDMNVGILKTDIANQPGDDGYIFNREGRLVGIAIGTDHENVSAYGISDLKTTIEILINRRRMPCLGIYGTTVTEEIQMAYELPEGIFISKIELDSPAFRGGLQSGDVIIAINHIGMRSMGELTERVLTASPGDELLITAMRKGSDGYRQVDFVVNISSVQSAPLK